VFGKPPEQKGDCPIIGTHDGHFHCDEALACAMLRMTNEFKNAIIVRSRNPEFLKQCNIVVDVGGEYDPEKLRFDHHQPSFTGTLTTTENAYRTKLSSAGLVYKHYGMEIVKALLPNSPEDDHNVVYDRVYKGFMEHIDGIDNGVEEYSLSDTEQTAVTMQRNYRLTTGLSARVGHCNPKWNENATPEMEHECFKKAMKLTQEEFEQSCVTYAKVWLPARSIVQKAIETRNELHNSGKIIKLEQSCPWQDHLNEIEGKLGLEGEVLYVLFSDGRGGWRIQCVGVKGTKFTNRKSLPEAWRGLRDAELDAKSGIDGCVFCHATGFIGGNKSWDGVFQMAVKSVEC